MLAVFKIALRALRRNILRSFLTMLGIIVGIAAVIVGVSMGTGAKAEVDKRIASMAQNLLTVLSGNMNPGGVRGGFGLAPDLTPAGDDVILVPYTSVMKRLSGDTKFRSFFVQAESPDSIADVQRQLGELLRQRHQIAEGKDDDFMVRTQQETSDFFNANNRIMTILIGFFAGISLVVGGIGIMNIMLVSVTERTREIGIRLAVGARGRDVLRQFLIVAVLLSELW